MGENMTDNILMILIFTDIVVPYITITYLQLNRYDHGKNEQLDRQRDQKESLIFWT